jgi:hypothetical protein
MMPQNEAAMKSPFPGMDPYLEKYWRDIHTRLVMYTCDQLEGSLPDALIARVEERIVLETDDDVLRLLFPDVRVVEHGATAEEGGGAAVGVAEEIGTIPLIVTIDADPMTETYIEITDSDKNRVITVIEFLSLTNKLPGTGWQQYKKKQHELQQKGINLVEIDLLRGGRRSLVWPMRCIPRYARTTYLACTSRAANVGQLEVYPIPLRKPLPKLQIPLRPKDNDIHVDLQPLLDVAYRKGRYGTTIDYSRPLDPPLAGADAPWADMLLKQAGKR